MNRIFRNYYLCQYEVMQVQEISLLYIMVEEYRLVECSYYYYYYYLLIRTIFGYCLLMLNSQY